MGNIYDHDREFIEAFLSDVNENQEILEWAIYDLEKNNDDLDEVNKAFRAVHNLKGITAMMDLQKLSHFIHKIEDMLHLVREKKIIVNEEIIDILYVSNNLLEKSFEIIVETGTDQELEFESIINSLKYLIDQKQSNKTTEEKNDFQLNNLGPSIEELHKKSNNIFEVKVKFNKDAVFLKVRAFMILQELGGMGIVIDSSPKEEKLKVDSFEMGEEFNLLFASQNERGLVLSKIIHLSDIDFVNVKKLSIIELNRKFNCKLNEDNNVFISENDFKDFEGKRDFIIQIVENSNEILNLLKKQSNEPTNMSILYEIYRVFHTTKGLGGILGDNYIRAVVNEIENYIDLIRKVKLCTDENIKLIGNLAIFIKKINEVQTGEELIKYHQDMRKCILEIKKESNPNLEKEKVLQLLEKNIDDITKDQKENLKTDTLQEESLVDKKNQKQASIEELKKNVSAKKDNSNFNPDNYIKVNMNKIDSLADMISEIMILQGQVEEELKKYDIDPKIINNLIKSSKLTKDVHNLTMLISMVSLKGTFQKIHRAAKDATSELGKNINIEFVGEETTIDRSIADKLAEPLLHMIKNSISHGVEDSEERIENGKNAQGKIKVEAYQEKGAVYIKIADDGRGLDSEKIYNKAIEKNIIERDKKFKEEEIYEFIFLPGFSTAQEINRISGRGVGMDIVKTTLKKLGGKLNIENSKGKGLTFILKIPINMSAINGTVIELNSGKFIVPSSNIYRIISTDKGEFIDKFGKRSFFKDKENLYQLVKLENFFSRDDINKDYKLMFILEHDKRKMAFPVKSILDKREIIVKEIGEELNKSDFFQGASILGDGKVSLIIDVEKILDYNKL